MRSRIYSKLAWTNICRNRKTYLPYMVSASGMVMMFFLTINLSMDPQVATFEEGNWMQLILRLGLNCDRPVLGNLPVLYEQLPDEAP